MPQLMPLNWIMSSMMIFLFLLMLMKMYGNYLNEINLKLNMFKYKNYMMKWYF